jgi:hypothetical protein
VNANPPRPAFTRSARQRNARLVLRRAHFCPESNSAIRLIEANVVLISIAVLIKSDLYKD